MVKVIFMYDVPQEKREEYLKVTAEVIKPFWESHGCLSYNVWQTNEGSPDFIKEMLFDSQASREKSTAMQADDPKTKEVVGLFSKYAVNTQRKSCLQKV